MTDIEIAIYNRENAIAQAIYNKKPVLVQNFLSNTFPVPTIKPPVRLSLEKKESDSISTADSMNCEKIRQEKVELNQSFQYNLVLTNKDKKTDAINEIVSLFNEKVFETCSIDEYQKFQMNTMNVLKALQGNWQEMKYQQAESLAAAVLLVVCLKSNIKMKLLIDTLKKCDCNSFSKLSSIKKTKSFINLSKIMRQE